MAGEYSLAGEGALWIQPDGPNTKPEYLGCHMLGDITEPMGDVTLVFCPDPAVPNRFKVIGSFQTQSADGVTTSIETDVGKLADYLEKVRCPVPLFVHKVSCGRKNDFYAYDRSFVLMRSWITQRTLSNMSARTPDDQERSMQSFEITAEDMLEPFELKTTRISISETEALNAIVARLEGQCAGDCGDAIDPGDQIFIAGDTLSGSPVNTADVWYSLDAGSNWTLFQHDPFAGGEVIAAIQFIQTGKNTVRILVARGTTDAGNPAEIAFSDDYGATWTHVDLGTVTGEYVAGPKGMYALDYYNIWVVTTGGYVYKSSDGGASFTAQSSADLTTEDLYAVHFSDADNGFAAGANNAILKTADGGALWEAVTGPSAQAAATVNAVQVHSPYRIWLAYDDGELWYSHDGGTNWYSRSLGVSGGNVKSFSWLNEYVGMLVWNNASNVGTVYVTINGGYSWTAVSTDTNVGLNDIAIVDEALAYAVGEPVGGTAMILKISGG